MRLEGRRALITGSSQGFGFAVARAFLEEGARVMLCARDAGQLDRARKDLTGLIGDESRVRAVPADVSVPADVERLVAAAVEAFGGLEVLVGNAAVHGPKGSVQDVSPDEWARAIGHPGDRAQHHGCRAVDHVLRAQGGQ